MHIYIYKNIQKGVIRISQSRKVKLFESVLKDFETEFYREYCKEMIEQMEDYLFVVPSSSSFKYHNKTQNQAGGQFYHVLMASKIANHILSLDYIKKVLIGEERRDAIRCAVILHDSKKYGETNHTVFEHPILAAKLITETNVEHDPGEKIKTWIGTLVGSHMGQWNTSKRSKTVLPEIESFDQFIVHLCDYLASRSDLDLVLDNDVVTEVNQMCNENNGSSKSDKVPTIEDAMNYVLPFGKYKGEKLGLIPKDYRDWLSNTSLREPLKTYVKMIEEESN